VNDSRLGRERWPSIRLGFLFREIDERVGLEADGMPLLSVSIHRGVLPRAEMTDREPRADAFAMYKRVAAGDVVINRMRAFEGGAGISQLDGMVSSDYAVLRPRDRLDGRYLHHLIRSRWFVGEMTARLRGIGNAEAGNVRTPRINVEDLGDIRVGLPSRREQREISDYLDAETARIDGLISRYLRLVDHLLEERGAITVAGVSGEPLARPSRSSSLTWLTTVPLEWAEVRLTLLARLGSGHTPSREHPEWWIDCTIPWITTGEVWQIRDDRIEYLSETREMISEQGVANSSAELHPAGTVVLSRTASAGYSAIMATDMATSQDYVTWTCGPRLRPRFLLLCLRAMRQDLLGRLAMGSTHQTIYVPDIQSIRVPMPPREEQDRLVAWTWKRLRRIDAATEAIRRQIELLAERRQALITAAVTGELDIARVAA
jgi:type I restriction enzyme, S subunit